jgi:hypothetical protein
VEVSGAAVPVVRRLCVSFFFSLTMVLGVKLAGFHRVVRSMSGVAGCDVSVMARRLGVTRFVVPSGLAMVMSSLR